MFGPILVIPVYSKTKWLYNYDNYYKLSSYTIYKWNYNYSSTTCFDQRSNYLLKPIFANYSRHTTVSITT